MGRHLSHLCHLPKRLLGRMYVHEAPWSGFLVEIRQFFTSASVLLRFVLAHHPDAQGALWCPLSLAISLCSPCLFLAHKGYVITFLHQNHVIRVLIFLVLRTRPPGWRSCVLSVHWTLTATSFETFSLWHILKHFNHFLDWTETLTNRRPSPTLNNIWQPSLFSHGNSCVLIDF